MADCSISLKSFIKNSVIYFLVGLGLATFFAIGCFVYHQLTNRIFLSISLIPIVAYYSISAVGLCVWQYRKNLHIKPLIFTKRKGDYYCQLIAQILSMIIVCALLFQVERYFTGYFSEHYDRGVLRNHLLGKNIPIANKTEAILLSKTHFFFNLADAASLQYYMLFFGVYLFIRHFFDRSIRVTKDQN